MPVPTYDKLFQPLLDAIHSLGGSASINLIDGEALAQKLKELSIGVGIKTRTIEEVIVDKDFFASL